jgi:hypothetical protein
MDFSPAAIEERIEMAPFLHLSIQAPHSIQSALSITALRIASLSDMASTGQASMHLPHPVHISKFIIAAMQTLRIILLYFFYDLSHCFASSISVEPKTFIRSSAPDSCVPRIIDIVVMAELTTRAIFVHPLSIAFSWFFIFSELTSEGMALHSLASDNIFHPGLACLRALSQSL